MIEGYIDWLTVNRWYSKNSANNYMRTLKMFNEYINRYWGFKVEECEKIKMEIIDAFVSFEKKIGKDLSTINNYLSWLRNYLRYCKIHERGVIDYREIQNIKTRAKKIDSLTDDEVVLLIKYFHNVKAETKRQELIKIRNMIIVNLFIYTWLRCNELSSLRLEDMQEHMQIIGKWWIRRYMHFHEDDLRIINYYKFLRKEEEWWLLVNHASNCDRDRLSNVAIETIIREWARKAWIEWKVFPHKLRHTFATQLLRNNANIYHIQKLLWHQNLNTTQHYLTVMNCELEATQNLVPRFW